MTAPKSRPGAMELLAPVGSFAAFEAALAEGADAVYVGAPALNARALSRDFTYAEIGAMVDQAHGAGVRVYVAMNSLIKEVELARAVEGLAHFAAMGADGLIVQDLGLVSLVHAAFPELPLHASTLMAIHNSLGVQRLVEMGCRRVVLPRELTIEEIRTISAQTGAELEVFVHGAMCFSYSGLCLFSSLHGGKSSMRGQCVQPCRRSYAWQKKAAGGERGRPGNREAGYLFSMNDLCGIDLLPQLRQAGVACLKIEGRMKSAQYVRSTVRAYRLLLDELERGAAPDPRLRAEARRLLDAAMGRRRGPGFFLGAQPQEAVTPHLSGNIGLMAGRVRRLEIARERGGTGRASLEVELKGEIGVGDRLRLHDERTGERISFTLRGLLLNGRPVKQARAGQKVTVTIDQPVPGARKGAFRGSLFKVDVSSRRREEEAARARFAEGRPSYRLDQRRIEQVLREVGPPAGQARRASGRRGSGPAWWVKFPSLRDCQCRLPVRPARVLLALTPANVEAWHQVSPRQRPKRESLVWCLPPVILEQDLGWYGATIAALRQEGFAEFQLGHFTQQLLFPKEGEGHEPRLYGDYSCNLLNSQAVRALGRAGFAGVQFSLETDRDNLVRSLASLAPGGEGDRSGGKTVSVGLYLFGRPPLFSARLDDRRYQYSRRFVSPRGETFLLERSGGMTLARALVPFSLLAREKELAELGIGYFVADLSAGNLKKNIGEFSTLLLQRGTLPPILSGNYLEGLA